MTDKNKTEKIRMLQCVFGTNICNLSCLYCGWPKKPEKLSKKETERALKNVRLLYKLCEQKLPNCNIFAITGGEPLLFPSIIASILKTFRNLHIKISTNAVLINEKYLNSFSEHGNVSLCISLDGATFQANKCRYTNENIFKKVMENLCAALEKNIPVEISCVINKENADHFPAFCDWIDIALKKYLDKGLLLLIAYPITTYTQKPGKEKEYFFSDHQKEKLSSFLEKNIDKYRILSNTKKYYLDFIDYLNSKLDKSKNKCGKYKWCLTLEYINNALWKSGNCISFGCGTKGAKNLGIFNLINKEDKELLIERTNSENLAKFFDDLHGDCKSKCFTNWHMIDLLYKGFFKQTDFIWNKIYKI